MKSSAAKGVPPIGNGIEIPVRRLALQMSRYKGRSSAKAIERDFSRPSRSSDPPSAQREVQNCASDNDHRHDYGPAPLKSLFQISQLAHYRSGGRVD